MGTALRPLICLTTLLTVLMATPTHASGLQARLYCEALLSLALKEASVPSLERANAREALHAFKRFERQLTPRSEGEIVPSVADGFFIRGRDAGPRELALVRAQIEGLNEHFHADDADRAQRLLVLGVNRTGRERVRRLFAEMVALNDQIKLSVGPELASDGALYGPGRDSGFGGQVQRLTLETLRTPHLAPDSWLYSSYAYRLRERTVKAFLAEQGKLSGLATEQELTNEAYFSQLSFFGKLGFLVRSAFRGTGLKAAYDFAFKPRWLVFDQLVTFDEGGDPTLTMTIRVAQDKPNVQRRTFRKKQAEAEEESQPGLVPAFAPARR